MGERRLEVGKKKFVCCSKIAADYQDYWVTCYETFNGENNNVVCFFESVQAHQAMLFAK